MPSDPVTVDGGEIKQIQTSGRTSGLRLSDERVDSIVPPVNQAVAGLKTLLEEDLAKELESADYLARMIKRGDRD